MTNKQIVSLSLEKETIELIDELSLIFMGNRSKLIDWLATRNFFLQQELVDKAKDLKLSMEKFGDKKLLDELGLLKGQTKCLKVNPSIASLDIKGDNK